MREGKESSCSSARSHLIWRSDVCLIIPAIWAFVAVSLGDSGDIPPGAKYETITFGDGVGSCETVMQLMGDGSIFRNRIHTEDMCFRYARHHADPLSSCRADVELHLDTYRRVYIAPGLEDSSPVRRRHCS